MAGSDKLLDPFDPAALRLSQDFTAMTAVKKVLNVVPVRKPNKHEFVRVHQSHEYCLDTAIVEIKDSGSEIYVVSPEMREQLAVELTPVRLFTAVSLQKVVFLWYCKLPAPDGRTNRWHESLLDATERAKTRWLKIESDMSLGAYQVYEAQGALPEPDWPEEPLKELLRIAFQGRYIDASDHPIVKRLRGLA